MKKKHYLIIGLCLAFTGVLFLHTAAFAAIIRIKPDGNDDNSGTSWALAKKTVRAAINTGNQGDEIWFAAGTYPEHIQNKVISDVAVDVALYGEFAGTETDRNDRNWNVNLTILDGGGGLFPIPSEIGSVVYIRGGATQANRIDGFIIIRGHDMAGGGILIINYKISQPKEHPIITQNVIAENFAIETGAGIAVIGSEHITPPQYGPVMPTITGNTIFRNVSALNGGGIGIHGHVTPFIANNKITANNSRLCGGEFSGKRRWNLRHKEGFG